MTSEKDETKAVGHGTTDPQADPQAHPPAGAAGSPRVRQKPGEIGGPSGPEPTRYGDWEHKGRCSDF